MLDKNKQVNSYNCGDDFTCPDCGRTSDEGAYDAGNGFCQDCASEH